MTPEVRERIEQIRYGNVPDGYRKTKAGILPADWTVCTFDECLERVERPVDVQADELYTQIGIRSHGKGLFHKEPVTGESLGNKAVYWIEPDCFVLNIVFAWEQAIGKTTQAEAGMIGSHRFPMYRPIDGKVDIDYLISYLLTKRGKDILEAASPGGAGRNRTLGQDRFMKSKIVLPSPNEQKKIAEILTGQDKVIELKEKRLVEKQRQKNYLMQQLLTGKKRLPGFGGERQSCRLHQIAKRIRCKNTVGNENVLTISAQYGLINQSEFFNKEIASEDKSNYYLLQRNDFAYNKSYSSGYPFGAIKRLTRYNVGIVSPLYICFQISDKSISLEYMEQYFEAGLMNREIQAFAQEGARNHGLLNIAVDDFFNSKLLLPPYKEQVAIAEILTVADKEIDLLRQDIKQEKQKKKALMQLLLTGIVRV
jgi:type I restriction enzyme S subunit